MLRHKISPLTSSPPPVGYGGDDQPGSPGRQLDLIVEAAVVANRYLDICQGRQAAEGDRFAWSPFVRDVALEGPDVLHTGVIRFERDGGGGIYQLRGRGAGLAPRVGHAGIDLPQAGGGAREGERAVGPGGD